MRTLTMLLAALAGIALGAASGPPAQAQSTTYRVNFATENQSMWGPPSSPRISDFTLTLAGSTWSNSGASRSVASVAGYNFGGAINAATSGDVAFKLRFEAPNAGSVSVDLPMDVTLGLPAANSFRAGQTITIPTSAVMAPEARIRMDAPNMGVTFVGRLGLSLSGGGEICVFGCFGFSFFPSINVPAAEADLFGLRPSGNGGMEFYFAGQVAGLPYTMDTTVWSTTGVSGTLDSPFAGEVDSRRGLKTLTGSTFSEFMDLSINIPQWMLFIHKIPIPLGFRTENRGGAQLTYETLDLSAVTTGTTTQDFRFTPEVYVTLALPESVRYTVLNVDTIVAEGTSALITMRVGHTLNLVFPEGRTTPLDIVPTFSITNTFSNVTSLNFSESLSLTAGIFGMEVPGFVVIPATSIPIPCDWRFWILDCTLDTPAVVSPPIDLPTVGPLVYARSPAVEWSYQVFPVGSASPEWELAGFNTVEGAPLALDPEAPVVAVHASLGSGLGSGAGPAGTLVHIIRLENQGDVQLSAVQAADALAVAAGSASIEVLRIRSRTLTTNASFDGTSNQNTLAGTDALATQDTGVVSVLLTATPGTVYRASVTGGAESPIGTAVNSAASATFAVHGAEAFPERVPHRSEGVITLHIKSAPGLDAANIHPGSVRLRGARPLDWSLQPVNGHNVLMLRFDRHSVLNSGAAGGTVASRAAPDVTLVASAVLSLRRTDDSLAAAADELGNRNGRLDLGDLRALLFGAEPDAADSAATAGTPPVQAAGAAGERVETLLLLGSWTDGTPFMAEASITVVRAGRNQ